MLPRLLALILIPVALVAAQEAEPKPSEAATEAAPAKPALTADQEANLLLSKAMLGLRARDEVSVRAKIKHKQPEASEGGGFRAGAVVVQVGGVTLGGTGFEGEVEAWRDAKGDTVVLSAQRLPGFALYVGQQRAIREATYETAPPDLSRLAAELVPLLDTERLLKHVMDLDFAHGRDPDTGDYLFRSAISKSIVNPTRNPTAGFTPYVSRVLSAEVRFTVSPEGVLKHTQVTVVHNDPMAEMRAKGGGFRIVGGGQQPPAQQEGVHDIEGASSIYSLDYSQAKPSEHAVEFLRRMRRLVASEAEQAPAGEAK